jgi:hypothetical protein
MEPQSLNSLLAGLPEELEDQLQEFLKKEHRPKGGSFSPVRNNEEPNQISSLPE